MQLVNSLFVPNLRTIFNIADTIWNYLLTNMMRVPLLYFLVRGHLFPYTIFCLFFSNVKWCKEATCKYTRSTAVIIVPDVPNNPYCQNSMKGRNSWAAKGVTPICSACKYYVRNIRDVFGASGESKQSKW